MSRTPQVSETEIIDAAERVMARSGADKLTLAAIAREVGLTRAAIAFRFESARALRLMAMERNVERFAEVIDSLDLAPGGNALMKLAGFIGKHSRSRANLAAFLTFSLSNARLDDAEVTRLERRRGEILRAAIARAMPTDCSAREKAVEVFSAHMTGSLVAWSADGPADGPADGEAYLRRRTAMLLEMLGIAFDEVEDAGLREVA